MNNNTSIFQKPTMQLLLIAMLCVFSATLFSIVAGLLVVVFFGFDLQSFNDYTNPDVIAGLKFFQLMSAIGVFIVPPVVYGLIVTKKPLVLLALNKISTPKNWLLMGIIMVISVPFMSWLVEFNSNLVLPDFLTPLEHWMKQSEQSAEQLTKAFLSFNGLGSFLYVLLIVAVVPAIGEELLFRGVLQKIMVDWIKNYHVAIWVTAILFSALHMQFYGFLPRMLLGAIFGYVFYWSGSLWLPVLGHFINNGSVVTLSFFYPEMINNTEISLFEGNANWVATIISGILLLGVMLIFKRLNKPNPQISSFN
ncbi:MAG: CPBP family intramembrane metalloprotease [Flavobacteriales bacterium]|nr:CPBP family intramembrane metalloprotease [Flavobacteriales bacterium]MCL4855744.1 CPBP family intramembrane metalloprotease [Flavobacteriales bacterium]